MSAFIKKIVAAVFLILVYSFATAQQQYTQTVTSQNRNCNSTCSVLDIPSLAGNTDAIIMITPLLANGANTNPHSIGVYYMYLNQWSVFNLDATAITVGAKFNIEYYPASDSNHFVFVVPQRVNSNDLSYIDHVGLNNHPNAHVRVFPHVSYISGLPGNIWNKDDVKVQYDATAGKWYVANINNTPVPSGSAYNVVFTNGDVTTNPPVSSGGNCTCNIPTSLPPNGMAGGDLIGIYPAPLIRSLQGNPLSNVQPTPGQVLKWDGTAWIPSNINGSSGSVSSDKPSVLYFNQNTFVEMADPNVNSKPIVGLNNQTFSLSKSSNIVFYTTVNAATNDLNMVQGGATTVWLTVEILNASNAVVAKAINRTWLAVDILQSINATGIGVLPAGNYKTRVTINRAPGGMRLNVLNDNGGGPNQGGQMIIEIFPG